MIDAVFICLFKCFSDLVQPACDFNVLRAFAFTLQTADAGACQSAVLCGIGIALFGIGTVIEQHVSVHDLEEIRNVDLHRAAACAVVACGTRNLRDLFKSNILHA